MNGNNIVSDTSLLVNFFNGLDLAKRVMEGRAIWISCITEIELLSYQRLSDEEDKLIRSFIEECNVVALSKNIRELTIEIRKNFNLKVPDAIIAATSVHLGFPLFTMDSDFKNIDYLNVVILEY